MSVKTLCLYHADCSDGLGAAYAVYKRYPEAEYVAIQHGDPLPEVLGMRVIMVDYCPPLDALVKVCQDAAVVHVLDHHATWAELCPQITARAEAGEFGDKFFHFEHDGERSGALMAWHAFHPNVDPPRLLEHISDRDLWQFKLPLTREIMAGLSTHPRDLETFTKVCQDMHVIDLAREGKAVLAYEQQQIQRILKAAQRKIRLPVPDHPDLDPVPLVNCPKELQSELLASIYHDHPYAVAYFDTPTHRVFGLRSAREGGVDVEAIARKFGGGGHKHAAGFQVPRYSALAQL